MTRTRPGDARRGADVLGVDRILDIEVKIGVRCPQSPRWGGPPLGSNLAADAGGTQSVAEFCGQEQVGRGGRTLEEDRPGELLAEQVVVTVVERGDIHVE